jgi:hypothetical protein
MTTNLQRAVNVFVTVENTKGFSSRQEAADLFYWLTDSIGVEPTGFLEALIQHPEKRRYSGSEAPIGVWGYGES